MIAYSSTDLNAPYYYGYEQHIGVRWQHVPIPRGATIIEARMVFKAAATSDSRNVVVSVALEQTGNAVPWMVKLPSSRRYGDNITWSMGKWYKGVVYETPDMSSLLQEIVDRPDWQIGNSIAATVFKLSSDGQRCATACEGGCAPALQITYSSPLSNPPPATPAPTGGDTASSSNNGRCPARVRKAYSTLSCEERAVYTDAVRTFQARHPDLYDNLVRIHVAQGKFAHSTSAFLPWHRWFLLQFENYLRELPGYECVTVPYWDTEKDANDEARSPPFRAATFGDFSSHPANTSQCVTNGVGAGFTSPEGCLRREHNDFIKFVGEPQVAALLTSYPSYRDFAARLEAGPHAAPHNFIGGDMATMRSPYDPLFWLLHANVDRLYALWQDYHGYDLVDKSQLGSDQYSSYVRGSSVMYISTAQLRLDSPLPFAATDGRTADAFSTPVTIRDMHDIRRLPGGNSYTYGVDSLGGLIGSAKVGLWDWVIPGGQARVSCCGDGTVDPGEECDDGNADDSDACSSECKRAAGARPAARGAQALAGFLPIVRLAAGDEIRAPPPVLERSADTGDAAVFSFEIKVQPLVQTDLPPRDWVSTRPAFADDSAQMLFRCLTATDPLLSREGVLLKLAHEECTIHGEHPTTTEAWTRMVGQQAPETFFLPCGIVPEDLSEHNECLDAFRVARRQTTR
ncbi:Tyrosinase [Diplonema papillatum]|nr:Tyrosinase [Diplonema papillatum]